MDWLILGAIAIILAVLGRLKSSPDDVLQIAIYATALLAGLWGWAIAPMVAKGLWTVALLGWWQWRLHRWRMV